MPTPVARPRAVRRYRSYTSAFRNFSPEQRQAELAELKALYEKDRLSIRRIAQRKKSTYGFIRARLLEAHADISANKKAKRQTDPHATPDQHASTGRPRRDAPERRVSQRHRT